MYAPFPTLTAADQAEQFVAERIAEGSDYLKIFSGIRGLWPSLDSGTIQALVTAAGARGLLVVAHVSSTAGVEVVSAGVDVVAHVPANAELDGALVERMAEARVVVGPTLATVENTRLVSPRPRAEQPFGRGYRQSLWRSRLPIRSD